MKQIINECDKILSFNTIKIEYIKSLLFESSLFDAEDCCVLIDYFDKVLEDLEIAINYTQFIMKG